MPLLKLTSGFLGFQEKTFHAKREHFEKLAVKQRPRIMMVACSDSRVDPAILTNAEAGELFTVRNVANLVPPCAHDVGAHGTSAALEFAVISLEVEHIIVLGHSGCGGIEALLSADPAITSDHPFIYTWMQIVDEARRRMLIVARNAPMEDQLRILEREAIKTSLANLLSFPSINERVADGRLRVHGWYFDLLDGNMHAYVPARDRFEPLDMALAEELQKS
ncbi:MAG: carbonic anhydrase [Rhodospirillales bacterium]|nr:carbonic anhydrase [Rhodospirillales bacterium]